MIRIQFASDEERIRGNYLLATHTVVRRLAGQIFEITEQDLKLLDEHQLHYTLVPIPTRAVRTTRFEILLPLNYNDGAEVEAAKFDETAEELADRFGALSEDTVRVTGTWKYGGARYRDKLFRIRVDSADPGAAAFIKAMKERWKQRFRQLDIWITAHEIEII